MLFQAFGPFPIERGANGLVAMTKDSRRLLWESVEECCEGLASGCGCYIVAAAGPNGAKPHYVGLTTRRSFKAECSASHVVNHFNQVISGRKLRPQLYLVAKLTPKGSFAKPSAGKGHPDIAFLETYMIGLALDRNSELRNIKQTRFLKDLRVEGFLNNGQGKPSPGARSLRTLLGRKLGKKT